MPGWLKPIAAIVAGCALILWHASRFGFWIVDDAAITFAYVRNITDGHGSVLQPGANPTEGFSNPAWLALLSIGRLAGLFDRGTIVGIPDYVLFPKALALLCCAGLLTVVYLTVRKVTTKPSLVTFAIGAGLAAVPSFVYWCFSGLENSLYALVVVALAGLLFRANMDGRLLTPRVALWAGTLAAIAALTRPDGLVYAGAFPLVALIHVRRETFLRSLRFAGLSVAAFAVLFGAYLTWRYLQFGRLLALPGIAKGQTAPEVETLARTGEIAQYAGATAALVLAVVIGLTMARLSRLRTGLVPMLVVLTLAIGAYSVLQQDWMGGFRFATPVWALTIVVGVLATAEALRHSGIRGRLVLAVALVAALLPAAKLFEASSDNLQASPTTPMCTVTERSARNFNVYADVMGIEQGSLLTPDVGGSALTSRMLITDLAGLTDSKMADFWGANRFDQLRDYVFNDLRPTFIEAHPPWIDVTGVSADTRLTRDYTKLWTEATNPSIAVWVRNDATPSPEKFREAQKIGNAAAVRASAIAFAAPRRHCGATLSPGSWPSTN